MRISTGSPAPTKSAPYWISSPRDLTAGGRVRSQELSGMLRLRRQPRLPGSVQH